MFSESLAFALGSQGAGAGGQTEMFVQFIPLLLMVAVFWFLLIRPQKKRQQEHKNMLEGLRRGDTIVTTGGLIGRIVDIDGDILTLDLGETKARVGRGFVSGLFDAKVQQAVRDKKGKGEPKESKGSKKADKDDAESEAPKVRTEDNE